MDFQLNSSNFDVMHDSEQRFLGSNRSSKSIKVSVGGKEYSIRTYTATERVGKSLDKVVEISHDKLGGHIYLNKKDLEELTERINQAPGSEKTNSSAISSLFSRNRSNHSVEHNLEEFVNEIIGKLDTIENDEYSQYAEEINTGKKSLLNHFGSDVNVNMDQLLKLAPHLEYVDLSDIEDKIEAQVGGGINGFLRNCQKMTVLKVKSPLEELIVQKSKFLKSIDASNAIKLNCSGCPVLTSIDAPNATTLDCSDCTVLESIDAPKVKFLDCPGCRALTSISTQNAKIIYCPGCIALTTIEAPNATELTCHNCTALESIAVPEVNILVCFECEALTSIAPPKATKLNCSGCPVLTSIDAPKVEFLDCSGCRALTSIDAPNAKELICSNCSELTSIKAKKAVTITCHNCSKLESIKAPEAQSIYYVDCEKLIYIENPKVQSHEINSKKMSLFDYFGSDVDVNIDQLLKLAPHLEYVDLSGIEDKIEAQVDGGINEFLGKCENMSYLKVSSQSLTSIDAPKATQLDCSGCTSLTSIEAPIVGELSCVNCFALTKINAPRLILLKALTVGP